MSTASTDDVLVLEYICRELHLPIYGFFNLAYAYKHREIKHRWMDVADYGLHKVIPDYALEFMYELITEVEKEEEQSFDGSSQET